MASLKTMLAKLDARAQARQSARERLGRVRGESAHLDGHLFQPIYLAALAPDDELESDDERQGVLVPAFGPNGHAAPARVGDRPHGQAGRVDSHHPAARAGTPTGSAQWFNTLNRIRRSGRGYGG